MVFSWAADMRRSTERGDFMAKKKTGRADGRKTVTFTFEGKRYYCYGRTKAEAREAERKKREELEADRYLSGGEQTLDAYFEKWEAYRAGKVRESTILKQRSLYRTLSNAELSKSGKRFGSLKLKEIRREQVQDLQRLMAEGHTTDSTNQIIAVLHKILHDAVMSDIIPKNPADGLGALRRTEPEARDTIHRALTDEELTAFFQAAKGSWYYWLFRFLLFSGMRIGEAGALKLSDIKPNGMISIERTLTRSAGSVPVIGKTTKTKKGVRKIEYTDELRQAVEEQRKMNAAIRGNVIDLNEIIFSSERGELIRHQNIGTHIKRICEQIGIQPFTPHAFRDTYATRAIDSGMNPKTLQEVLGHSSISMTMDLYAHTVEETKREQMRMVKII